MGKRIKHAFALSKKADKWGIKVDGKYLLSHKTSKTPFLCYDHNVVQYILDEFNNYNYPILRDGVFHDGYAKTLELMHSVVNHNLFDKDELFWKSFIEKRIPNEHLFTVVPFPHKTEKHIIAYQPLHLFLSSNNIKISDDVFLNSIQLLEDKDFLKAITILFTEKFLSFSLKKRSVIYYIANSWGYWTEFQTCLTDVIPSILYLGNEINKEEYLKLMSPQTDLNEPFNNKKIEPVMWTVYGNHIEQLTKFLKYWESLD